MPLKSDPWILLANAASTWAMTGLILFVHVVHYPLFAKVGEEAFAGYHAGHTRATSFVVIPFMLVELATALLLVMRPPQGSTATLPAIGLGLVVVAWLATFAGAVPAHEALGRGFDAGAHARLLRADAIRTVAWVGRSLLVTALLVRALPRT